MSRLNRPVAMRMARQTHASSCRCLRSRSARGLPVPALHHPCQSARRWHPGWRWQWLVLDLLVGRVARCTRLTETDGPFFASRFGLVGLRGRRVGFPRADGRAVRGMHPGSAWVLPSPDRRVAEHGPAWRIKRPGCVRAARRTTASVGPGAGTRLVDHHRVRRTATRQ